MKKMKRILTCLMIAASLFTAASVKAIAAGNYGYSGSITIFDDCKSDKQKGTLENGPALCFEELLAQWQSDHPETKLIEKKRTGGELNSLACMDHLPDVFMLSASAGRIYANYGLIQDLTDSIIQSEDVEKYDLSYLGPFLYYGKLAAFPMLAQSNSLVIYNAQAWKSSGLNGFPQSWEEAVEQAKTFKSLGYQGMIAIACQDSNQIVSDIISSVLTSRQNMPWFQEMIDANQSHMFRDDEFIDALSVTTNMLLSDVFGSDSLSIDTKGALNRFVKGDYPALLVNGNDLYAALDRISEDNPTLYSALYFDALPVLTDGDIGNNSVPTGISYGLFINVKTAADPDKLAACVDLCKYLTGPIYSELMAERYGRTCFAKASEDAWNTFYSQCNDEVLKRLSTFTNSQMHACINITQYLDSSIWSSCKNDLLTIIEASTAKKHAGFVPSLEEISNSMQNLYEKYYLNSEVLFP